MSDKRTNAYLALGVAALAVLPILLTSFPPSTDLPQHIAQVRLFKEALANPGGGYVIQWFGPNNLIYFLLLALSEVLPVGWLAQATLILIVLSWIAAIYWLGKFRSQSFAPALLGTTLIFNQAFYWGFLNFLIGFPVFVLWFLLTINNDWNQPFKYYLALTGTAMLLYESHALWFAAGAAFIHLLKRAPLTTLLLRVSTLAPCGVAALIWYPQLSAMRAVAGNDVAAHWSRPFDRILHFMEGVSGGTANYLLGLGFVAILLWLSFALWQNRYNLKSRINRDLLSAFAFFMLIVIISPDKYMDTISFSGRWVPIVLLFILLALPVPSFRRLSPSMAAASVAMLFFVSTSFYWHLYDRNELNGFRDSLISIPASSRVLGLDLIKYSDYVNGRPFLQLFAYAQVYKGGELNFSFAEHYSGLVAYRGKRNKPWTRTLEWFAEELKREDFQYFDYVIVNGEPRDHMILSSFPEIVPLSKLGRWRAYRVVITNQKPPIL